MRFLKLRFLVFFEEYNVKIVFLHDQGDKNQPTINQTSMQKRGRKKVCKHERKWNQMGVKMEAKIHAKRSSGAKGAPKSEKYRKTGMPETMPKFDAEIVPEK